MRCRKTVCSVNLRLTNLKATQKPVKTEHRATSRPWGCRLAPLPFLGRPKNLTSAGTLGSSASVPSPAKTRCLPFQSMRERKFSSYRCCRRSQSVRQKLSESCPRAKQKASSVTQVSFRAGQIARTRPQAWVSPWVIDFVVRATYIMSHTTTSGIRGRLRCGSQPPFRAAMANSSGGKRPRKGAKPKCCRMCEARGRHEPIEDIAKPPCKSQTVGGSPKPRLQPNPSARGGFFHR